MLAINKEFENYSYIDITALEEVHGKLDDATRDSFIHYNKALDLIKSKSEDIAILEVKRAINLNPHFNEAQNLLGLLYALTGEEQKAVEIFKGVIEEEKNSIRAVDYIGKINGLAAASSLVFTGADSVNLPKKAEVKKNTAPAKVDKKNDSGMFQNYVGSLRYHVIGYIVIFAASAIIFGSQPKKTTTVQVDNSDTVNKLNATIKDLTDKNSTLVGENSKLKEQVDSKNAQEEIAKNGEKLNEAENLYAQRKYEQSADLLLLLKDVQFNEVDKNRYTKLLNNSIPAATWSVYSDGMNYFNATDYKTAIERLSKSISYGGTYDYTQYSYYNLGRAYQYVGDNQNAVKTYNAIKEKFPNSESAVNADYRLSEIK